MCPSGPFLEVGRTKSVHTSSAYPAAPARTRSGPHLFSSVRLTSKPMPCTFDYIILGAISSYLYFHNLFLTHERVHVNRIFFSLHECYLVLML